MYSQVWFSSGVTVCKSFNVDVSFLSLRGTSQWDTSLRKMNSCKTWYIFHTVLPLGRIYSGRTSNGCIKNFRYLDLISLTSVSSSIRLYTLLSFRKWLSGLVLIGSRCSVVEIRWCRLHYTGSVCETFTVSEDNDVQVTRIPR